MAPLRVSCVLVSLGMFACVKLEVQNSSGGGGSGGAGGSPVCVPRVCVAGNNCEPCHEVNVASQSFGPASGDQIVHALGRSSAGDVMIAGDFVNTIDIGAGTPSIAVNTSTAARPFAALIGANGKGKWIIDFGSTDGGTVRDGYIEPNDDSVVVGGVEHIAGVDTATVHKVDRTGKIEWKVTFGTGVVGPNNEVTAVARDATGDVLAAAFVLGSFSIPCGPANQTPSMVTVNGMSSLLVVRLDAKTGACRWAAPYEGGVSFPTGITSAPNGQVVVTGNYQVKFSLGGMPILPDATPENTFVVALDGGTGKHAWARAFVPTGSPAVGGRITIVNGTQIVSTGLMYDSVDFGEADKPLVLKNSGLDPYIVSLDLTGKTLWARRLAGTNTRAMSIAATSETDGSGALYLSGVSFAGPLTLKDGDSTTTLCPMGGMFLVRIDAATGEPRYGNCFGTAPDENYLGQLSGLIAVDASELVLGGSWRYGIDFGAGAFGSPADKYPTAVYARFSPLP